MNSRVRNPAETETFVSSSAHFQADAPLATQVLSRLLGVSPAELHNISDRQREDWIRSFGESAFAELLALSRERNFSIFGKALLAFGIGQKRAGRSELAQATFAALLSPSFPPDLQQRAQGQLQDGGSFGERFESRLHGSVTQISDLPALAGTVIAGGVFQAARFTILGRLLASPIARTFTRGLGAEAVALSAASLLELPVFTFAARGAQELTGHPQIWSREALPQDLFANGLTLLAFKASQAAGNGAMRSLQTAKRLSNGFVRFSAATIPAFGTLAGVLGARALDAHFDLRQFGDPTTAIFDSFVSTFQLHASGRILSDFTGPRWGQRWAEYRWRVQNSSRRLPEGAESSPWFSGDSQGFRLAWSSPSLRNARILESRGPQILMNEALRGKKPDAAFKNNKPAATEGTETEAIVSLLSNHELLEAIKARFYYCAGSIFHLYYLASGESAQLRWLEPSLPTTMELSAHLSLLHDLVPDRRPEIQPVLEKVRKIGDILSLLQDQNKEPPSIKEPEVQNFLAHLYKVPNLTINYLDQSRSIRMETALGNAENAHKILTDLIPKFYGRSLKQHSATPWNPLRHLAVDKTMPMREIVVPIHEDFLNPAVPNSNFSDIPGNNRRVLLLGNFPLLRTASLIGRHQFDAFDFNINRPYNPNIPSPDQKVWQKLQRRQASLLGPEKMQKADYLEGYDIVRPDTLKERQGEKWFQENVLRYVRDGGVIYLVSSDREALERMVDISIKNQWAGVLRLVYDTTLPKESERSGPQHIAFLRKFPDIKK